MNLSRNDPALVDPMPILAFGLLAVLGCATQVPPAALAWNDAIPHVALLLASDANDTAGIGYLRVETGADLRMIGREAYYNLRRPYDLYSDDGHLLQADIDNRDGRSVVRSR